MDHVEIHKSERGFAIPCMICPQELKCLKTYKKHKATKHKENIVEKNPDIIQQINPNSGRVWACGNCDEKLSIHDEANMDDFEKVKTHCYFHAKNEEVSCFICSKRYKVCKYFSFWV